MIRDLAHVSINTQKLIRRPRLFLGLLIFILNCSYASASRVGPDSSLTLLQRLQFDVTLATGAVLSAGVEPLRSRKGLSLSLETDISLPLQAKANILGGFSIGSARAVGVLDNGYWKASSIIYPAGVFPEVKGYEIDVLRLQLKIGAEYNLKSLFAPYLLFGRSFHDFNGSAGLTSIDYVENGNRKYEVVQYNHLQMKKGIWDLELGVRKFFTFKNNNNFFFKAFVNFGLGRVVTGELLYWTAADSLSNNFPPEVISPAPPEKYSYSSRLTTFAVKFGYRFNNALEKVLPPREKYYNHFYFLMGAESPWLSLNYERQLFEKQGRTFSTIWNARIGIGGFPYQGGGWGSNYTASLPVGLVLLKGGSLNFFEFSATAIPIRYRYPFPNYNSNFYLIMLSPYVGYRFQSPKGLLFRIGYSPLYYAYDSHPDPFNVTGHFRHWAGLGFGFSF